MRLKASSQGPRKTFPGYVIIEPNSRLLKVEGNGRRNAPRQHLFSGDYLISHTNDGKPSGWIRFHHRLERKCRTFEEAEAIA